MTCSACSTIVEAALRTVPGVTNSVVSLLQQVARDPVVAKEVPQTLAQKFPCFLVVMSCCRRSTSAKQHFFVSIQSQMLEAVTETGYTAGLLGREDISSVMLQISDRQMFIAVPA